MSDNFPILIDVEEHHVGRVLRLLDETPGIVNIHLQMRRERLPAPQRGPGRPRLLPRPPGQEGAPQPSAVHPSQAVEIVGRAMMHGAVHYKIIREILHRAGFSRNNVYKSIARLVEQKLAKRVAPGTYRLTEKGERKFSSNQQVKSLPDGKRGQLNRHLLTWANGGINHEDLKDKIVQKGYAKNNLYSKVPALIEEGYITRTGDQYTLSEKGREKLSSLENSRSQEHETENVNNG